MRTPLRPLALILNARARGENPDGIQRENARLRNEAGRDRARSRAEIRLLLLGISFAMAFATIGGRMGMLSWDVPAEPQSAASGAEVVAGRAEIVDRNGRILATNMTTNALYAHPKIMVDPGRVASELAAIFPELDAADLARRFTDGRSFVWIRRVVSPEQMQRVHEIGDPGLLFGPREMRLYPNGRLAAHVLGGTSFGAEAVASAELIGTAGIERQMNARLSDPALANTPLALSLDLTVQATVAEVLQAGMAMMNAKAATAIVMDVKSGEVLAMVSLPDFDPNDRPPPATSGDPADSPLFNRAVQGMYELGSTFKIFAISQAMQIGLVTPDTMVDANAPMRWGRFTIKEFEGKNYGPLLSVSDVIAKSSNVATARIGLMIGGVRQREFLQSLGLLSQSPVEVVEASKAKPIVPDKWPDIVTITASYGHGIASSPMNLAAAYAAIANGGVLLAPTLLRRDTPPEGVRVMDAKVAADAVKMLRLVVTKGTASMGDVKGYEVAGKTGTADKPSKGGYTEEKVINTFASTFPASDPRYVLVLTLDEPVETSGSKPRRTAGWTSVPVAAEVIRRIAPILGLRPTVEPIPLDGLTAVSN